MFLPYGGGSGSGMSRRRHHPPYDSYYGTNDHHRTGFFSWMAWSLDILTGPNFGVFVAILVILAMQCKGTLVGWYYLVREDGWQAVGDILLSVRETIRAYYQMTLELLRGIPPLVASIFPSLTSVVGGTNARGVFSMRGTAHPNPNQQYPYHSTNQSSFHLSPSNLPPPLVVPEEEEELEEVAQAAATAQNDQGVVTNSLEALPLRQQSPSVMRVSTSTMEPREEEQQRQSTKRKSLAANVAGIVNGSSNKSLPCSATAVANDIAGTDVEGQREKFHRPNRPNSQSKLWNQQEIEPAFLNEKDYPPGWLVYHPVLGVVSKEHADKYDKEQQRLQQQQQQQPQQPVIFQASIAASG